MRLLTCSAIAACIAFTAPQIAQAQDLGSNFKRDKNVSVRQRPRPDYEATGQKTGGFTVYPRVTVDLEHNDNIYAVASGETDDTIWRVKPELAVRSDWSRHALGFFAGGNVIRYSDNGSEDAEEFTLAANGRVDIARGSNITGSIQAQQLIEPRTSITAGSPAGATPKPVQYNLVTGSVALVKEFNRLRLTGRLDDKDFNYEDQGSPLFNQNNRDRNEFSYGGKAEYALSPDTALYAIATGNKKSYDTNAPAFDRSSDGYVVGVGANFDLSEVMRGDLQVGYMKQSYDQAAFKAIDGFNAVGRLEWFPTQLTTIGLNGSRTIEESVAPLSPGFISNNIGASIDHELLRNVLLSANASYGKDAYEQIDRDDKRTNVSATATYLVNRRVGLFLTYNYLKQESQGNPVQRGASFSVNKITASVALQF
ncbi:outer membrane beta-barrel protein [Caulobacter sp. RHG1]|uniref:outer membrane beta-barrel protein n=1 Tax=Caulobacter sp. (strain RHG1) TaxID=2545762 RepID=UPI00155638EC|nr:outer membrane beta-barrel protein [Caulobacter sp. RHG1]NQE62032.1 Outer membrane protein/protective antigen OMA87 [Caulobacter sp. RHG1]